MGSFSSLFFIILLLISTPISSQEDQTPLTVGSSRLLDLTIRDYTVKLFNQGNFKTGVLNTVHLPSNLSGIGVHTVRFRCGSLRRYGARIEEFHIGKSVSVNPFVERVVLIKQELGSNWSNKYYNTYNLDGYELITPVLGLLAYNGGNDDQNVSTLDPFELEIIANEMNPIRVYFTNVSRVRTKDISGRMAYCAYFGGQGKVGLESMVAPNVCEAKRLGHFGLVVQDHGLLDSGQYTKKMRGWKVALASSIGGALGAFLLGLLLVAMFVKAKKRSKLEDMVRRAYEEEALQVSMVGHVRPPPSR